MYEHYSEIKEIAGENIKILIIGNIGSGKTTLGIKLAEMLCYKLIQIDKIREKYSDGTVSGEYLSLYYFLKHIEQNEDIIIEFTGAGCHKYAIKRALELSGSNVLILVCRAKDLSTIIKRAKAKKFNYKIPFKIDLLRHIHFIENEINTDLANGFWSGNKIKVIEVYMDTKADIQNNINLVSNII